MNHNHITLPAEWEPQSGVLLTWPHAATDWVEMLDEVESCFAEIAIAILKYEKLLVVCQSASHVKSFIPQNLQANLRLVELDSNDTWARDHGAITIIKNDEPVLVDFKFNGWGLKFAANKDNLITSELYKRNYFKSNVKYLNRLGFVFEGGSIESDGKGTILTTSECLLSPNRNGDLNQQQIEDRLKEELGAERVLWLNNGYLAGDDTDSHIDTLARFCNENTIAYVKCTDSDDEHFEALNALETELKQFKTMDGKPYNLIALPMADTVIFEDHKIPATYANFLIVNDAVLVPSYNSVKDIDVENIMKGIFADREIIMIDCSTLIKQHGSLHCVTMQFPQGVIE